MITESKALVDVLESYAKGQGVDMVGVADMAPAREFIRQTGGDFQTEFPRAVSLLIHTSDTVMDRVIYRQDPKQHKVSTLSYRAHSEQVSVILNRALTGLTLLLENEGWQAYPVFPGDIDPAALAGSVSQKIAAHLSGLGWIGKNCLLVSPRFGPRVRMATLLTDAPLPAGQPGADRCGSCRECVDICPIGAIKGRSFRPEEPREARFDARACSVYANSELDRLGIQNKHAPSHVCGLCLYVCPFGKRGSGKG